MIPRAAGVFVLGVVLWHGLIITQTLGIDYLFSICILANILIALGVITRSRVLIGIGFGWAVIALPLWAFHAWSVGVWMFSSVALHLTGLGVGYYALRQVVLPGWLMFAAMPVGLFSCLLARLFTNPVNNINAVFRVQQEWGEVLPDFRLSIIVQILAYSLFFILIPVFCNRWIYSGPGGKGRLTCCPQND